MPVIEIVNVKKWVSKSDINNNNFVFISVLYIQW